MKFYSRFVYDTLLLAKPFDFSFILNKLNSFHPQLQFTIDSFTDDQDIHFLDIKITPKIFYRKSTHTGQYVHLSSFTRLYRKTAWLRALIHRAYKLCSNSEILSVKLSEFPSSLLGMVSLTVLLRTLSNTLLLTQLKI